MHKKKSDTAIKYKTRMNHDFRIKEMICKRNSTSVAWDFLK